MEASTKIKKYRINNQLVVYTRKTAEMETTEEYIEVKHDRYLDTLKNNFYVTNRIRMDNGTIYETREHQKRVRYGQVANEFSFYYVEFNSVILDLMSFGISKW